MPPRLLFLLLVLFAPAGVLRSESLWLAASGAERSMFADRRAQRPGDILTIVVQESATASNTQKTRASKNTALQGAIERFLFSPAASGFGSHNGELPSSAFSGSNEFSASGEIANRNSLTTRAAVLVVDVQPNGNLVLEGVRVVTFGGETTYAVLTGVVRPDDITSANTVSSTAVANARVEFITEGSLTASQRKGWLTKVYETLRPF
jgi:flagellar L-ring protein precursor FlgH